MWSRPLAENKESWLWLANLIHNVAVQVKTMIVMTVKCTCELFCKDFLHQAFIVHRYDITKFRIMVAPKNKPTIYYNQK